MSDNPVSENPISDNSTPEVFFVLTFYCVYNSLADLFYFEIGMLRSRGENAFDLCGFQSVKIH